MNQYKGLTGGYSVEELAYLKEQIRLLIFRRKRLTVSIAKNGKIKTAYYNQFIGDHLPIKDLKVFINS
jgi:hypothetical protein